MHQSGLVTPPENERVDSVSITTKTNADRPSNRKRQSFIPNGRNLSRRIYLTEMHEFPQVDAGLKEHFGEPYPMGICIQFAVLGKKGARMEIKIVSGA